jgi:hypothetical protein
MAHKLLEVLPLKDKLITQASSDIIYKQKNILTLFLIVFLFENNLTF